MIYEINNLSFTYPQADNSVLNDVSLTLAEGAILSILGPNGAGKSTLLNCMAGLLKPTHGEIKLFGQDLSTMTFREIAQVVGYVQQIHTPAYGYSVLHFVTMGRAPRIGMFGRPGEADQKAAWDALEALEITYLAYKPYTEISGGEMQKVAIARAMVQEPKVILFDEPTAHLDSGNQLRVLNIIRDMAERGYSVVMTTHNPDHALLLGGDVAILGRDGRLQCGSCHEIITEELLLEIYNARLCLIPVPELGRVACIPPRLDQGRQGPRGRMNALRLVKTVSRQQVD